MCGYCSFISTSLSSIFRVFITFLHKIIINSLQFIRCSTSNRTLHYIKIVLSSISPQKAFSANALLMTNEVSRIFLVQSFFSQLNNLSILQYYYFCRSFLLMSQKGMIFRITPNILTVTKSKLN